MKKTNIFISIGISVLMILSIIISGCANSGTPTGKAVLDTTPEIQNQLKSEPEVTFTIVNRDSCAECDPTLVIEVTKQLFPKLITKEVDVDSEEGKKLIEQYNAKRIPFYVFSMNIENSEAFTDSDVSYAFEEFENGYKLYDEAVGSTVFILEEDRIAYEEAEKAYKEEILNELLTNENLKGTPDKITAYFFWGDGCGYCARQKTAMESWPEKYPKVEVKSFETWGSQENSILFQQFSMLYGFQASGVPTTFIGDQYWVGADIEGIENYIEECIKNNDECKSLLE